LGFAVACGLLAALGLFELFSGRAGVGMLSAVAAELVLAAACLAVQRRPVRQPKGDKP
jgi:hypothetical protein